MPRRRAAAATRPNRVATGLPVLVLALGPLCGSSTLAVPPAAEPAARVAGAPTTVVAEPAMREVTLTGFTRARARLPLVAEVAGTVTAVHYDVGELIGPDGTFAQIDDTFLRLDLDLLAARRSQVLAQIAYDEREVARFARLARENNAAVTQLDAAEQTLRNNRFELQRIEAEAAIVEERLRRTRVQAPPGWRVSERRVEPRQTVTADQQVAIAADLDTLVVPFALTPEQHAALLRRAAGPDGLALDLPDRGLRLPARVYRDSPDFDPETRKIAVELVLDPDPAADPAVPGGPTGGPADALAGAATVAAPVASGGALRGGLRALLTLPLAERSGAVLLPAAAVRRSLEESWVAPLDSPPVRVLLLGREERADGLWLRVSGEGLAPGDRVRLPAGPAPAAPAD